MKNYYPVNLDVTGKKCLVVGGGVVAERKVNSLLRFGATVAVVSPVFTTGLKRLAKTERVLLVRRKYRVGDLRRAVLTIAATDDSNLNRKVSKDAKKRGIPVNVVDAPELCSFIVPSVIKRGPLVISISTSGQAPALAKALRIRLEKLISPRVGKLAGELGKIRNSTKSSVQRRQQLGTASYRTES